MAEHLQHRQTMLADERRDRHCDPGIAWALGVISVAGLERASDALLGARHSQSAGSAVAGIPLKRLTVEYYATRSQHLSRDLMRRADRLLDLVGP